MKKQLANQTTRRPLNLDRETIRRLSSDQLVQVGGGGSQGPDTIDYSRCRPCTKPVLE